MPCHNPTDEEMQQFYRRQGNYGHLSADELEAVACGLLRTGKVSLADVDWSEAGVESTWAEQWWADHQARDATT